MVAVLVIVALIVINSTRGGNGTEAQTGPAPAHANQYGGITLTSTTSLEATEPFEVDVASLPEVPTEAVENPSVPPGIVPAAAPGDPTTAATAIPRKISSVRASATSHTASGLSTTGKAISGKV